MAPKRLLTVAAADPTSPTAFLATRLGIDAGTAREWLARGAVQIGQARVSARTQLRPGQRLVVREPRLVVTEPLAIAHQDDALLIVDKPAGMLTQPAPGDVSSSLVARVQAEHPSARLMHRIDRDTSGLVLFALHSDACAAVQHALAERRMERNYLALVEGVMEEQEIRLRVARVAQDTRRRQALPEGAPGGDPACTLIVPRGVTDRDGRRVTLVEARLTTGRTHQIRVHLAAVGHPVVGDRLYGGAPASRLLLHAARLALPHPDTGAMLAVEAPAPPELTAVGEAVRAGDLTRRPSGGTD